MYALPSIHSSFLPFFFPSNPFRVFSDSSTLPSFYSSFHLSIHLFIRPTTLPFKHPLIHLSFIFSFFRSLVLSFPLLTCIYPSFLSSHITLRFIRKDCNILCPEISDHAFLAITPTMSPSSR